MSARLPSTTSQTSACIGVSLALLALNRASPKLSRSAPPNGHLAHLRGHGAFMGPFKATLPEAGMMASPKAEPLLWRMPGDPRRTRASVSAEVPGGGAIALATLERNSS